MSLFAGQHVWYDLSGGINDVPCEKCHADVAEEMQSDANGAHRNLTCAMCHRTCFNNYGYAKVGRIYLSYVFMAPYLNNRSPCSVAKNPVFIF